MLLNQLGSCSARWSECTCFLIRVVPVANKRPKTDNGSKIGLFADAYDFGPYRGIKDIDTSKDIDCLGT